MNRQKRHGETEYWESDMWRFVTVVEEGRRFLLTCELRDYELNQKVKVLAAIDAVAKERAAQCGA